MENAIEFNHVWKKFKRGEKFNSIRDTIPKLFKKMFSKNNTIEELESREFWAVNDVNFSVKKGEVVGVIGPNGAGKSTILKLLSRIIIPNKGDITINGRLSALIEVTAGFHNELTGRENIYLNGTILGMNKKEIDDKIEKIIEFSGISEFIDTPVKRYSSGMFSRLGFSVAAHVDPDILLVDEVLSVGDIAFQSKCAQKMREMLNSGVTILLVSHNLSLIQSLCSRVILINQGKIQKEGKAEEVIPYYENVVYKQMENQIKYKIHAAGKFLNTNEVSRVNINKIILNDGNNQLKDSFETGEDVFLKVEYVTQENIEEPVFSLEIIRADGVICCETNSMDAGLKIDNIENNGVFNIKLEQINLTPGVYLIKAAIWDKEMIHPIVIRKEDVLRINVSNKNKHTNAVFFPKTTWLI